jgi:hypothetical protein
MGGVKGCTHLRKLLFNMATVAYRTIPVYQVQFIRKFGAPVSLSEPPAHHRGKWMALAFYSPAVQRFYPRYFGRRTASGNGGQGVRVGQRHPTNDKVRAAGSPMIASGAADPLGLS